MSQSLPEDGIKVFASQLHTHLTGRRAYTKHYRDGVELPELNRDDHYSPHYQEIRKLPRQVHVLPVSLLVLTSSYLPPLLPHDATAKRSIAMTAVLFLCLSDMLLISAVMAKQSSNFIHHRCGTIICFSYKIPLRNSDSAALNSSVKYGMTYVVAI